MPDDAQPSIPSPALSEGEAAQARARAGATPAAGPQDAVPEPPAVPAYLQQYPPETAAYMQPQSALQMRQQQQWQQWQAHQHWQQQRQKKAQEPPAWRAGVRPAPPARIRAASLWAVLATALLSALFLGDGLGPNLLIVAVPAALGAYFAAQAAGRRLRPWTLVWGLGGLALLAIPALRDAGWPTFLAVLSALALGSLALHGSRSWAGVLIGSVGIVGSLVPGVRWGWRGVRERASGSRDRWGPVIRTGAIAVGLLVVFGALFVSADAAFAKLLGDLVPDVSVGEGPWRFLLFLLGLIGALAAARTAAAPHQWDKAKIKPGRARKRLEWAVPLIVLNLLFAAFIGVQLAVLLRGYEAVLDETDLPIAEYARQGFWQLLWATLLTIVVIAFAKRWAPRGGARDHLLVRCVLGVLCLLTLVVVASALSRMNMYVDAYGLTRLRISVAAMELWLGVVIVLIMAAGVFGARWLPRAVAASAGAAVLAFGLVSPDALVAERNVARYEKHRTIDVEYLQDLSADAVPALDKLPEPLRSCALDAIREGLDADAPWYATSRGEQRALDLIKERPLDERAAQCRDLPVGDNGDDYR
ncbi:hypothetical protein GCM10010329_28510 [Streptomyces spiroverticillatus]|uniref:DUF4173 domain-containing protein n=1 Tax=Streptomyces finlayi TaxID=67296 RepID=A0A919C9D2_9ACTN|nr:DUF4173 domain-containing protein [Streptomyces finlayi]GHA04243.1 hypothetical protein GCM10010329_28510 [Streptomyces spiroverticillatus]GHC88314.1 hypothetical protein GCM10010334_20920 [Streptomyces finlayi]